jgi:ABC-type dipeptide/oligopeptide/nickel transport system permease component
MKFGPIEGTPQEVKDYMENNGLDPNKYFEVKNINKISVGWIFGSSLLFLAMIITLTFLNTSSFFLPALLVTIFIAIFCTAIIHLHYENSWCSTMVGVGLFVLISLAAGFVTPKQAISQILPSVSSQHDSNK